MKIVTNKNKEVFLKIESHEELCYIEILCQDLFYKINKECIDSGEPPYRYGHLIGSYRGIEKAIFMLSFALSGIGVISDFTAQKYNKNPILYFDKSIYEYMTTLTKNFIANGASYISLSSGGISLHIDDEMKKAEAFVNGYPEHRFTMDNFRKTTYFF